jgi:small subunit ribosomal protein S5
MADRKTNKKFEKQEREYDQKMVDLARVTRVMAGGKRMSFRACVVIGDRKGKVSYGLAKGPDVQIAIGKAVKSAEHEWLKVKLTKGETIPHLVDMKLKSAHVLLKPAPPGTGIKAGGAVRVVLDLAGVKNVVAKQLGAKNKVNNVKATYAALKALQEPKKSQKLKNN